MPALCKQIGVAVDLAGCPNRCRHCWLGHGPNRRLPRTVLREVAEAFWGWTRPGGSEPYFEQVDVGSWYREPDFSDKYRDLHDLSAEVSRRAPRRYELLSVWRLARDGGYAAWAKSVGPRACQITFFGMREATDDCTGRRGAFADNLKATERLLEVGMVPRWQVFLLKRTLPDLRPLMDLVRDMRLRERVRDLGEEFVVFAHPPGPTGEGFRLEEDRIEERDLAAVPEDLLESTRRHYGGRIEWKPECVFIEDVRRGATLPREEPPEAWLFVNADLDVFWNGGELTPPWRLGNFRRDPLPEILAAFEADAPPGLRASSHVSDAELAERFGRPDSRALYHLSDVRSRWVRLYVDAQAARAVP